MARLNVEMDVFSDDRFLELVAILGDQEKAVGRLVLFWSVAQKYWKRDRQMVPLEVFKRRDWQVLVDVGLAEIRGSEVYAKGSEQSFDWLLQRKEAAKAAGKKSAELRSTKSNQTEPNATKSNPPSLTHCSSNNTLVAEDDVPEKFPVKKLAEVWNAHKAPCQPAVLIKTLTPKTARYRSAKARISENPSLEYWEGIIRRIADSPFCRGEVQIQQGRTSSWVADFTWLVQVETHIKVSEGRYDRRVFSSQKKLELFTGEI
jgi:hypothetical protein